MPKINVLHVMKPDQLALNRNPRFGLCVHPLSLSELKQGLILSIAPPTHHQSVLAVFTCSHHSWVNLAFEGSVSPPPIKHACTHTDRQTHTHTQT